MLNDNVTYKDDAGYTFFKDLNDQLLHLHNSYD